MIIDISKYIKKTLACGFIFVLLAVQGCGQSQVEEKDFTFYYTEAEKAVLVEAYDSALSYYNQALEVYVDKEGDVTYDLSVGTLYFNMGYCYEQLGHIDDALTFYTKSLEDDRSKGLALTALGQLYFGQKNYELSKNYYERAIEVDGYGYEAYVNLSAIYSLEGDSAMALSLLTEAIEMDSMRPDAYLNRAYLFAQLGNEKLMKEDVELLKSMNFSSLDVYIKIFNDTLKEGRS